jgi:hypothetical protein
MHLDDRVGRERRRKTAGDVGELGRRRPRARPKEHAVVTEVRQEVKLTQDAVVADPCDVLVDDPEGASEVELLQARGRGG